MQRITKEFIERFLKENKLPFSPSQKRLCLPIINRICRKMLMGIRFDDIKVCENLVVNGHHRYVSSMITGRTIGFVPTHKTSATVACEWTDVEFDENDWDTKAKIRHLNELDAEMNNVEIAELEEMTDNF